jgi:hypothetical protein
MRRSDWPEIAFDARRAKFMPKPWRPLDVLGEVRRAFMATHGVCEASSEACLVFHGPLSLCAAYVFTIGESRKQRFATAFLGNTHETIA